MHDVAAGPIGAGRVDQVDQVKVDTKHLAVDSLDQLRDHLGGVDDAEREYLVGETRSLRLDGVKETPRHFHGLIKGLLGEVARHVLGVSVPVAIRSENVYCAGGPKLFGECEGVMHASPVPSLRLRVSIHEVIPIADLGDHDVFSREGLPNGIDARLVVK